MSWAVRWKEVSNPVRLEKTHQEIGSVSEAITCLVAHPKSDLFLVGTAEGKIHVWDPAQRRITHSFKAHAQDITQIVFVPDSNEFVSTSLDRRVQWWGADFSLIREFSAASALFTVAFSPSLNEMVAAGEDKKLYIFDAQTGTLLDTFEGQPDQILALAWIGDAIVSCGEQGNMFVWEVKSRRCMHRTRPHQQRISQIRVSNDGRWYVTGSWDQNIRVWSRTHRERFSFPKGPQAVTGLALTDDDKLMLAAYWDGTVQAWDVESGKLHDQFSAPEGSLIGCALLAGQRMVVTASQKSTLSAWNLDEMGSTQFKNQHNGEVYGVEFTPENTELISVGQDSQLKTWDRLTREESGSFDSRNGALTACAVSPAGEFWVLGDSKGWVKLWRSKNRTLDSSFKAHEDTIANIKFLPTGSHYVTASWDLKLKLWSVETQSNDAVFDGHNGEVSCCDVSLDGRRLASASWDGSTRVWDLTQMNPNRRKVKILEGHNGRVLTCSFSPDGGHVLTGGADHSLRLWSLDDGAPPKVLLGHGADVTCCRFTPDGKLMLSADRKGTVMIWDAFLGEPLRTLRHDNPVLSFAIAPDCLQGVIGDETGQLRFFDWDYEPGLAWVAAATYLKKPPIWRWGSPPDEHYDVLCPVCASVEPVKPKQFGKQWACPNCQSEWMLCTRPIPAWVGNQD